MESDGDNFLGFGSVCAVSRLVMINGVKKEVVTSVEDLGPGKK